MGTNIVISVLCLSFVLNVHSLEENINKGSTWYKGCTSRISETVIGIETVNITNVYDCVKWCSDKGFQTVFIQEVSALRCACSNLGEEFNLSNQAQPPCCRNQGHLHVGGVDDCWAVYNHLGPYLTSVTLATDSHVVPVNKSVAIEIQISRAARCNVSIDDTKLGHEVKVRWMVTGDNSSYHDTLMMRDALEILARPKYTFNDVGMYTVAVEVTNGINTLSTTLDLQVDLPFPHDLQIGIADDAADYNRPTCVPDLFQSGQVDGQSLAVFSDTSFMLEASVAMGDNLTFNFLMDDVETRVVSPCEECHSVVEEYIVQEPGIHRVKVAVSNIYGTMEKNITLIVIKQLLSNLTIDLDPSSKPIVKIGEPVYFIISMVTTSRTNRFLQVTYGDGHSSKVSLKDTTTPRLVIEGSDQEMDIIASYGDSCTLSLKFYYIYHNEGHFEVNVSVFDGADMNFKKKCYGLKDLEKSSALENLNTDGQNAANSSLCSKKIDNADVKLQDKNVIEGMQSDVDYKLEARFERKILVLNEIAGVKLRGQRLSICGAEVQFQVQMNSKLNVSVHWSIYKMKSEDPDSYHEVEADLSNNVDGEDLEIIEDFLTTATDLFYRIQNEGSYLVHVTASNTLSEAEAVTNVEVQCPIEGLKAVCSSHYLMTGEAIQCAAKVLAGSDVVFRWMVELANDKFANIEGDRLSFVFNHSWIYSFIAIAMNNVSRQSYEIVNVYVQDEITSRDVHVLKMPHTLQGNETALAVVYQPAFVGVNFNELHFELDFGNGRVSPAIVEEDPRCYVQVWYKFSTPGVHQVLVYVYNQVSEYVENVTVWVHSDLQSITMETRQVVVAGSPTRFYILRNGTTMETGDVYFTWKFSLGGPSQYSNAPIAEFTFLLPGSYTVWLNGSNPVSQVHRNLTLNVLPRSETDVHLQHNLFVTPGHVVTFTLYCGSQVLDTTVLYNHFWIDDTTSMNFFACQFNDCEPERWTHQFFKVGLHEMVVTATDQLGTSLEVMTSSIFVQEPITGLRIAGPSRVTYQRSAEYGWTQGWRVEVQTGTNVLYNWTFCNNSLLAPTDIYEVDVPVPGVYKLTVSAFNDVTPTPLTAELIVTVGNWTGSDLARHVDLRIIGGLVDEPTHFQINITGGNFTQIAVNFGDGSNELLLTQVVDQIVLFNHTYREMESFNVTVNVSTSQSCIIVTEVFNPILSVTLKARSPKILKTPSQAVVMASVEGGPDDVGFVWNFSDLIGDTIVKHYLNQTSVARHPYSMSGDYSVTLNVTGKHYPPPGIYRALDWKFLVVDAIDLLKLYSDLNASALIGNSSTPVTLEAKSSGSHVRYVFDFGDGHTKEVAGEQASHMNVGVTMFAKATHLYSAVGEYTVSVTAYNPLGNRTAELSRSFWVQRPPVDLHICNLDDTRNSRYIGKVGETIRMCANVTSGTNVTFDWKLGDQSDIVKAGSVITHQYMSPGMYTVYVTAKNHVKSLVKSIEVNINYAIQGISLLVASQTVALGDEVLYRVRAEPEYSGIVTTYRWNFKEPRPTRGVRPFFPTTLEPEARYSFQTFGRGAVSITALNAISNATTSIDIHVVAKITLLEIRFISNVTERQSNRPIRFGHWAYGTDMNITWHFGDGWSPAVTNLSEIEYTFAREGVYNVTVVAQNPVSSMTVSKLLFILNRSYCDAPRISIINKADMKRLYSQPFIIEAEVQPNCNLSSSMTYEWKVDGHLVGSTSRVLVLPSGGLTKGSHSVIFKVSMAGTIVFAIETTRVEISHSPLVARIKGGIFQTIHHGHNIIVDGSTSFDPDDAASQDIRYQWECLYVSNNGKYGSKCYHSNNNSCQLATNSSVLNVPSGCLVTARNYTMQLNVYKDGRQNGTAFQTITVVRETERFLDVRISRPAKFVEPVNPNRKVSFFVECTNCPHSGLRYEWYLKHVAEFNVHNVARAHDQECVDKNGEIYSLIQKEADEEVEEKLRTQKEKLQPKPSGTGDSGLNKVADQSTHFPLTFGQIKVEEASADMVANRRRRSSTTEKPLGTFLNLKEEKSATIARGQPRDIPIIGEKKDGVMSRGLPISQIEFDGEGMPGESGSAGGRNYPKVIVEEQPGGDRGSGTGLPPDNKGDKVAEADDGLDKLIRASGDPGRPRTLLDRPLTQELPLPAERTRTGLHSESLVIKPGVLRQSLTYLVGVRVYHDETGLQGEAISSFDVNASPVNGKCTVKPENGTAMETEFTVNCHSWEDEHEPLLYEVSYTVDQSAERTLIYRGVNRETTFRLPAGRDDQSNVHVHIAILDVLLARTSVCVTKVKVTLGSSASRAGVLSQPEVNLFSGFLTEVKIINDEIASPDGALQKSFSHGDDAITKAYIGYLATRLNDLPEYGSENTATSEEQLQNQHMGHSDSRSNFDNARSGHAWEEVSKVASDNHSIIVGSAQRASRVKEATDMIQEARTALLNILEKMPVRDEAEVLQAAQALAVVTHIPEQLSLDALDKSLRVLRKITSTARSVYDDLVPSGELVALVVGAVSSVVTATNLRHTTSSEQMLAVYRRMMYDALALAEDIVQTEMRYQVTSEEPILSVAQDYAIMAAQHSTASSANVTLSLGQTTFHLPPDLKYVTERSSEESSSTENSPSQRLKGQMESTNGRCFRSHMTSFESNPFHAGDEIQIQTVVSGLELFTCNGEPISVKDLEPDNHIQVELPILKSQVIDFQEIVLKKWEMNIHQFNISLSHVQHALHLVFHLKPWQQGRPFQISLLISYLQPPLPSSHKFKYDLDIDQTVLDLFLPAGTFNETGMYYIGIVDSAFNAGRIRPGEVTHYNYTLQLWWGQCLYWHVAKETWLPDGCSITPMSTIAVTRCSCNHLTAYGGTVELIPNKLSFADIEGFFRPNENPVTLSLLCVVITVYCILINYCRQADRHDNQKGGIVYLLDNTPMDQQKYEITMETGCWRHAGTTSKISLILHGEEGMSETRELISEDDRPMFERNSRDKFILTLPDSIGKIWKVQIWHNNFGPSPSWYLSRVIVRDLNTGNLYLFLCEKWLAVEEQDGKVEREFMALDGTLDFNKAYMTKVVEYMADFHIWLSLVTCPPYSGFMRCERLTVCLTMLLAYMCLNAMWYRSTVTEHHGEFGLLDVSWQSVTVGAICCAVVIPLGRMLEFLFRRSKPKHASNVPAKDAVTDWEPDYPSGKPNEAESEASSEQVLPVMTYSLFDQSILNWPNIQTWAQKQWMKRQQTGRSVQEGGVSGGSEGSGHSHPGNHILGPCSHHGNHILGPGSHHGNHIMGPGNSHHGNNILGPGIPVHPVDLATLNCQDSELDQASSGFEDCHFLLQQKTSADSTHTTAAPSINESLRVHKPQSLPDSLGLLFTKQLSEGGSAKTIKAPSISSNRSNKSVLQDRRKGRLFSELYLPFWCRYIAWSLCAGVCVGGATVTVMYGYTFGTAKSTLWLQSLYFSMMICVFIANPVLIMITVVHAALVYKHDPMSADCHGYEIFNHEKAQEDLKRWKQQLEDWDEGDALERGVAARQRSRYLRFARPPQEKQLIEARKRVMKEKRAIIMFREVVVFLVSMVLLLVIAYGKNNVPSYHLNRAVKSMFIKESMLTSTKGSNPHLAKGSYLNITSPEQWYHWARIDLLSAIDAVPKLPTIFSKSHNSSSYLSLFMIGEMTLRQQRVQETICPEALPYAHASCLSNHGEVKGPFLGNIPNLTYSEGASGNLMIGNYGIYDGSGFVLPLSCNRLAAEDQINTLAQAGWLDRHTRVVFVELTLYNPPTNLFTAVRVTSEFSNMGRITSHVEVTSTQLFRYVTPWDNILLACELLFFVLMMLFVKNLIHKLMQDGRGYFFNLWNVLNFLICLVSMFYCGSFIYRFVIVADLIERLRSTYYEKHVNVCFVTFWDEMLRSLVGMLVFLCTVRCVRLLRFNAQFARLGDVYRKARRELVIFFGIFCVLLAAYSSLGHQLFGCMSLTFRDLWSSLLGVTALLSGRKIQWQRQNGVLPVGTDMFLLMISTFGTGIMVAYMVAVLSHFLRSRKKRRLLALDMRETLMFYWEQFQLWTGLKKPLIEEEPVIILPPEFTMAEIEYQVDELLFRMNALTGSHGLPEKPPCYLTDSDCTYGAGDDGISSGGSEGGQVFTDDRLEQRVQKIEDNLCSQEPFLAQLLKLDCLFSDDLSQQKEKQLRSHLEMEIFRQLQMQRQDSGKGDHSRTTDKGGNPQPPADTEQGSPGKMKAPHSPGQNSTSSEEMVKLSASANKTVKPRRTRNNFTVKTIQDLLAKSGQEVPEFLHENSSSNPDSPKDKKVFSKSLKPIPAPKPLPHKRQNSTSSSEKVSDASNGNEPEVFKKPTKPTFLHSRESSLSEGPRGSPILKLRTCSGTEKMPKSDGHLTIPPDTSSGSEQDGMQVGKKLLGKRNLRKTKSRGKGKGPDNLEPELVLDELDFEDHQDLLDLEGQQQGKGLGVVVLETVEGGNGADLKPAQMPFNKEHVVTADVHQVYM